MTKVDLKTLFITTLLRRVGGSQRRWRIVISDLRVYSLETHLHCNWAVMPAGTIAENAAVERLADELRSSHPIVTS
jgi:hypothetical protein